MALACGIDYDSAAKDATSVTIDASPYRWSVPRPSYRPRIRCVLPMPQIGVISKRSCGQNARSHDGDQALTQSEPGSFSLKRSVQRVHVVCSLGSKPSPPRRARSKPVEGCAPAGKRRGGDDTLVRLEGGSHDLRHLRCVCRRRRPAGAPCRQIAAALMAKAPELLAQPPTVEKVERAGDKALAPAILRSLRG